MQFTQFKVTGMTCGGCSNNVTKALNAVNGAVNVNVSLAEANATVEYDEKLTTPMQLKVAITEAGYGVVESNNSQPTISKGCCG